jgi:hypothetical protein
MINACRVKVNIGAPAAESDGIDKVDGGFRYGF